MIYTQQRRRALNKATRAMYPNIEFYESPCGIPVMECAELPEGAGRVDDAESFLKELSSHCIRVNDVGMHLPDYGKSLPVFIRSMELEGREVRHYYRVNYVSLSEASQARAAQYIAQGKLYAAPSGYL